MDTDVEIKPKLNGDDLNKTENWDEDLDKTENWDESMEVNEKEIKIEGIKTEPDDESKEETDTEKGNGDNQNRKWEEFRNMRRFYKRTTRKNYQGREPERGSEGGVNVYRIKVSGLPRFYSPSDPLLVEFKKMLREELHLDFHYIRSPKKGNSWLYITFLTIDDQMKALSILKRYTWKERTIIGTLVVADLKRKTLDEGDSTKESKKAKYDIPIEEQMLMSTIPYHSISYEEQLSKKNEETVSLLKWLNSLTEKRNHLLSGWFDKQVEENENKLPFKLDDVRQSPVIDGYRNKCEFRIGKNRETNAVTVGYRVDNQHSGSLDVALPDSLRHLPKQMIQVSKAFEKFIDKTELVAVRDGDSSSHNHGILKILTVRINKANELMLVLTVRHNDQPEEEVEKLKQELIEFFTVGEGKECNVVSMYLFVEKEKDVGEHKKIVPVEDHIWGSKYLEEDVMGLKLEITPDFYFQCNTYSAEVLYQAVAELAAVDSETTVLDLCCGSGGMGMVLAKQVKEVIGVELMDTNVEGAKRLAQKNGLENCEFVQGKIDDVYASIKEKLKGKKVVPILDPPRAGISQSMIVNLRELAEAEKLIYVCSNHKLPLKNLLDLATVEAPLFSDTNPFVVTQVIPIDVSPHTLRCELVILCERLDMKSLPEATRDKKAIKDAQNNSHLKKRRTDSYRWRRYTNSLNSGVVSSGVERRRSNYYGAAASRNGSSGSNYQQTRKLPSLLKLNLSKNFNPPRGNYPVSARDSLYPPPLRDALYNSQSSYGYDYRSYNQSSYQGNYGGSGGGGSNYFDSGRGGSNWSGNGGGGSGMWGGNGGSNWNGSGGGGGRNNSEEYYSDSYDYEARFTSFRRDFEAAINSSYHSPGGGGGNGWFGGTSNRQLRGNYGQGGGGNLGGNKRNRKPRMHFND